MDQKQELKYFLTDQLNLDPLSESDNLMHLTYYNTDSLTLYKDDQENTLAYINSLKYSRLKNTYSLRKINVHLLINSSRNKDNIGIFANLELAYYYQNINHSDSAMIYCQRSIKESEMKSFPEIFRADMYYLMGWLKFLQRDNISALIYLQKSVKIYESTSYSHDSAKAICYEKMARCFNSLGNVEMALMMIRKSLQLFKNHDTCDYNLLNTLSTYHYIVQSNQIEIIDEDLELENLRICDRDPHFYRVKGFTNFFNGQLDSTVIFYRKYLQSVLTDSVIRSYKDLDEAYYVLALAELAQDNTDSAMINVNKLIAISPDLKAANEVEEISRLPSSYTHAKAELLRLKARILLRKYHLNFNKALLDTIWSLHKQVDTLINLRRVINDENALLEHFRISRNNCNQALEVYTLMERKDQILNRQWLQIFIDRTKAGLLYEKNQQNIRRSLSYEILDSLADIEATMGRIINEESVSVIPDTQSEPLYKLMLKRDSIYLHLVDLDSNGMNGSRYYTYNLKQLEDIVGSDGLVQYYSTDSLLYILIGIGSAQKLIIKNANSLKELSSAYIQSMKEINLQRSSAISKILYTTLLSEVDEYYDDDIPIHIIPDSYLASIPFEELQFKHASDSTVYHTNYIFKRNVYRHYSLKHFTISMTRKSSPKHSLIKSYIQSSSAIGARSNVQELPGSYMEAQSIKKYFPLAEIHYAEDLSKMLFLEDISKRHDILHIGLHGKAALANRHGNYFLLHSEMQRDTIFGYEIRRRLINNQITILGSCESGAGMLTTQEGLFSLGRDFFESGSNVVISNLWPLDDYAMSVLAEFFYKELSLNRDPVQALHNAKCSYVDQADVLHKNPYFWAGLIAIGTK